jgi:L-cysteine/cystine lyase
MIALTQGTADALRTAIEELSWRPGDEAICTQLEHEACSAPLQALARSGRLTLRVAQVPAELTDDIAWLTDLLSPRTRLVAFSAIAFETGMGLPIAQIAQTVRAHGALSLLDAAQGAGAIALDLAALPVDFCALPLQKWLCGPEGLGALVTRSGAAPSADRVTRGWGVFEAAAAQLEWMRLQLGWEWITERTMQLAAHARRAATAVPGVRVLTPADHGGLVTLEVAGGDARSLATRLHTQGFVFRCVERLNALRISTAFFNTESEIDRFCAALGEGLDA